MKAVVIDLDGTLANIDHRTHWVKREKPDWDAFYSACNNDTPNEWCVELMRAFRCVPVQILIVSARRDSEYDKTCEWLKQNLIPYDRLEMLRKGNDHSPDTQLKSRWLKEYGKENIIFVVDDRQKVVDMWRAEGVVCLQCYAWPEYEHKEIAPLRGKE